MATLNYQYVDRCEGGGHVFIDVSFNEGAPIRFTYATDELRAPISTFTQDNRELFALMTLKVHYAGQTRQQMHDELTQPGGITVTI
jgi:hypothetical protein